MKLSQILNLLVGGYICIYSDVDKVWYGSTADLKKVPDDLLNREVMSITGYGEMRLIVALYK